MLDQGRVEKEVAAVHAPTNDKVLETAVAPDSRRAWMRLGLALLIASIGSVGLWTVVVVLPVVLTSRPPLPS